MFLNAEPRARRPTQSFPKFRIVRFWAFPLAKRYGLSADLEKNIAGVGALVDAALR
jgi:hypothetical protein